MVIVMMLILVLTLVVLSAYAEGSAKKTHVKKIYRTRGLGPPNHDLPKPKLARNFDFKLFWLLQSLNIKRFFAPPKKRSTLAFFGRPGKRCDAVSAPSRSSPGLNSSPGTSISSVFGYSKASISSVFSRCRKNA